MKIYLVADDLEVNNDIFRKLFKHLDPDAFVATSSSGSQLIDLYKDLVDSKYNSVRAVFIDYAMPGQNGLETLRGLRELGYEGPAYLITGRSAHEVDDRCLEEFTDIILKPLDIDKIKSLRY